MNKFALLLTTAMFPFVSFASPLETINLCYQEFREEMITAALTVGDNKKIFEDAGFKINWIKNDRLSKSKRAEVLKKSNLNLEAGEHYYNSVVSEIALLQEADQKKCDFVSTTFEVAMASNIALDKMHPVAIYRYGKDYDTHLVVRADSDIKSIKDLKGKRIRVNQIGSLIPFENMLKEAGVSPSEVSYEKVTLANIPKSLDDKKIDAVLSYNPTIPLLLGSGRVRILEKNMFSRFYGHYVPHSLLLASKEFSSKNPTKYERFVKAFTKASEELSKKPENMIYSFPDVSKNYTNLEIEKSLSYVSLSTPSLNIGDAKKDFLTENKVYEYANLLKERGFLKNSVNLKAWN